MKKIYYLTIFILSSIILFDICSFVKNGNIVKYTMEEIEVAKTITMEACGEDFNGMYGVANVINNRSIKYNMTPFEVVSQKNQFVGYTHKNRDKRFAECKEESLYLAHNIGKLKDITNEALYFKTQYESKRKWHKIKTITIKNHEFWK